MHNSPNISIIMAAYNSEKTIVEAVESIFCQTYSNWELIICDDGSSDSTWKKMLGLSKRNNKIKCIKNESNYGLATSLNKCLKYAQGPLIARMDADDISDCNRLELQINYLLNSNMDLIGTAMISFSSSENKKIIVNQPHPSKKSLIKRVPFFHPTIMTYKSVYDALGGYTESSLTRWYAQDYDLWYKFFKKGFKGENMQIPLYFYRKKEGKQKTKINFKYQIRILKIKLLGMRTIKSPLSDYLILFFFHLGIFLKSVVRFK